MKSKESIRLFLDAHVFDGQFQGTRTYIKEIYSLLIQKENISLFIGAKDIENLKKDFLPSWNVFLIKYESTSSFSRLLFEIPSLLKKHKIDFAHFQYITPLVKKCKYIVTIHDVIFNEYPQEFSFLYRLTKNYLYKRSALNADIVTTVSDYSKKSIQKYFGIEPDDIAVIPNAVSAKFFEPYNKQKAKNAIREQFGFEKYILFVSRIEPRKNHILLLEVYLELKLYLQGYHLVFLGHESIPVSRLHERINHLPETIKSYILIRDNLDDKELMEFYRAADLFVYPSKAEGFGIPPLEAGALKIPVICSNTTAMRDFTFFEKTHIDPFEVNLLKDTLSVIIQDIPDDKDLDRLSKIILSKYSWAKSAESFYLLLLDKFRQ
jgi:glycosyltransferase involved in cell wall biosynthesis